MAETAPTPMSTSREKILGRVRAALHPLTVRAVYPDYASDVATLSDLSKATDLWAVFEQRLQMVNGIALKSAGDLASWLKTHGHTCGYCDPELWSEFAPSFDDQTRIGHVFDRTRIDEYTFGITRAAGAIAETGTIILNDVSTAS